MDDDDRTTRPPTSPPGTDGEASDDRPVAASADSTDGPATDAPGTPAAAIPAAEAAAPAGETAAAPATGPRKKRRGRKILIRTLVALAVIAGLLVAGGTYYFDHVTMPDSISMDQATTIYYADGSTPMARIGDTNRTAVAITDVPLDVQHAVVAAQDETFYTNSGVDYGGVASAMWNSVTGDDPQGESTISQQYARQWAQLEGASYARKLRESVIALKMNKEFTKDKILEMYLNIVYFGRGAYGIQAAAQAYFGKPAKELTLAEGIVLAGLIDNPEGDGGKGSPFDPTVDAAKAHERFDQIKRTMVGLKFVTPAQAEQKAAYPAKVLTAAQARDNSVSVQAGVDKPEGLIVHHVLGEVAALTDPKTGVRLYESAGKTYDRIRNGGLKIVTTIDRTVQQIAVREAGRNAESNLDQQPANLQAALVAVEPGTGAVKAYYGGDKGTAGDYAGYYNDPVLGDGQDSCCGGHPAGATFNMYGLATGLMGGYSTDSYWNGESPQDFPGSGRTSRNNNAVRNLGVAAAAPQCASGSAKYCTLDEATVMSLNTPFFGLAATVGPAKLIDTVRAAGINNLWSTVSGGALQRIDLTQHKSSDVVPKYFNTEVAYGQYPVTVLDQAGGLATFAARGLAARTHFLKEVWENGKKTYNEVVSPKRIPGFTEAMADDLNTVLQGVPKHYNLKLHDDRQVAGVTGTWQLGMTTDVAHAWMLGYAAYDPAKQSAGLAVAVWVGNKAEEQKLVDKSGRTVIGGTLPGAIWRDFLDDSLTALNTPKVSFPPKAATGDKLLGTGVKPGP